MLIRVGARRHRFSSISQVGHKKWPYRPLERDFARILAKKRERADLLRRQCPLDGPPPLKAAWLANAAACAHQQSKVEGGRLHQHPFQYLHLTAYMDAMQAARVQQVHKRPLYYLAALSRKRRAPYPLDPPAIRIHRLPGRLVPRPSVTPPIRLADIARIGHQAPAFDAKVGDTRVASASEPILRRRAATIQYQSSADK